jgi:hypothetical protein
MWGQIFQKLINSHIKYAIKFDIFEKFAHIAILKEIFI